MACDLLSASRECVVSLSFLQNRPPITCPAYNTRTLASSCRLRSIEGGAGLGTVEWMVCHRPVNYAPSETDHDKVKARGKEIMEKGLELMDKALEGKDYLAGKFTIADAALFYVEFWASKFMKLTLPKNCAAHYERMKSRPAVKRVLDEEGLSAAA